MPKRPRPEIMSAVRAALAVLPPCAPRQITALFPGIASSSVRSALLYLARDGEVEFTGEPNHRLYRLAQPSAALLAARAATQSAAVLGCLDTVLARHAEVAP
jgi:hypothetical protein